MPKNERIRDPIHDLIEFDKEAFEAACWEVVQTRPFQRLRRIKQLGFSEFVYPGAVHTRLAHSLGVFHTARQLAKVIKRRQPDQFDIRKAQVAMAAALIHDIGHGPFSHAFEGAQEELKIGHAHETWTQRIVLETEVKGALDAFAPNFSRDVAAIFDKEIPENIYDSIVSSQFDADRLDYMRRDRMMTGTQSGAIDFTWLLANLEVRRIKVGQDEQFIKEAETFVLGPKAVLGAEAYVLGLFQLYPTVYLHKTTRGAEKLFTCLMTEAIKVIREGKASDVGLPDNHPIVKFAKNPDDVNAYLTLDDSVIWGSLHLLRDSPLKAIAAIADRLLTRSLYKAVNVSGAISSFVSQKIPGPGPEAAAARQDMARKLEALVRDKVREGGLLKVDDEGPVILQDAVFRNPYRQVSTSDGALNHIWGVGEDGVLHNLMELSRVVGALTPFRGYRLYYRDDSARKAVDELVRGVLK